MDYLIVKNFYRYPDGREVLEKHLYFPDECDVMELRKKTNWVKGDKEGLREVCLWAAGEVPGKTT